MNRRGFTLIELLVVISIIGLLSSVVLASLNQARAKAQISKVKQDFKQLQTAIELYKSDHNGNYPLQENPQQIALSELSEELSPYIRQLPNSLPSVLDNAQVYYNSSANPYDQCNEYGQCDGYSLFCGDTSLSGQYSLIFEIGENTYASDNFLPIKTGYPGQTLYSTNLYCIISGN